MNQNQLSVIENRIASFPGETWGEIVERVVNKVVSCEEERVREEMREE